MSIIRPADALARERTEEAMNKLTEIMRGGEDRDAIRAAEVLLDRGHGKAAQAIIQVPASKRQKQLLAAMSEDELMDVIESEQLPRLINAPERDPLLD